MVCAGNVPGPACPASPAIFDDKDDITADANPASPFRDSVYAAWTKFTLGGDQILFSRSTDGGATWGNPLPISPGYNNFAVGGRQGAAVKVGPDGTVFVVWLDTVQKQTVERMSISHDGGKTFPAQNIIVATVTDDFVSPVPGSSFRQDARAFPSLTIAVDGTMYVAWSTRTGDPTSGHAVVMVTKSADGGLTWSTPVAAGDVDGRSPDGSSTNSLRAQFLGDYITAVADATHVYAVWTDSRSASSCSAVDAFRAGTGPKPDVITQCPTTFGNTDIFLGIVS